MNYDVKDNPAFYCICARSDVKFMQCDQTATKVRSRLDLAPETLACRLEAGPPRLLPSGAISAAVENQSSLNPPGALWHRGLKEL